MNKPAILIVVRSLVTLMAMVLIWHLVMTAIENGINGVILSGGVAAIAGLGGYQARWLVDAIRTKSPQKESDKK